MRGKKFPLLYFDLNQNAVKRLQVF